MLRSASATVWEYQDKRENFPLEQSAVQLWIAPRPRVINGQKTKAEESSSDHHLCPNRHAYVQEFIDQGKKIKFLRRFRSWLIKSSTIFMQTKLLWACAGWCAAIGYHLANYIYLIQRCFIQKMLTSFSNLSISPTALLFPLYAICVCLKVEAGFVRKIHDLASWFHGSSVSVSTQSNR